MLINRRIEDTFRDIVEAIRDTNPITNVVQNAANDYVLTSNNSLVENDRIQINNATTGESFEDVLVKSATETSFTISTNINYDPANTYNYVANYPYFLDEEAIAANRILTGKNENNITKFQKYPLVLLIRPFAEDNTQSDYIRADLKVVIVNPTNQNYSFTQRKENNYNPVLEPIYLDLLRQMARNKEIQIWGVEEIQHVKIDHPLLGDNPLPDFLDAIMIEFKELIFKRNCNFI